MNAIERRVIPTPRALTNGAAWLVGAALCLGACGGSGPTAPSRVGDTPGPAPVPAPPSAPTPSPSPSLTSVTFSVRSGAEGLRAVPGATIRAGEAVLVTSAQGTASLDALTGPVPFLIEAPGHLSYRGLATSPLSQVVLWPWQAGMTERWVTLTSYYGPDYNVALWRPDRDVRLDLQGVLAAEPYRSVWEAAVLDVASAIESGSTGPSVRLDSGPGSTPVRLNESPTCQPVRWGLVTPILTPPPVVVISAESRARDAETVLAMVTYLVGFHLGLSREHGPPHAGGRLSAIERTALRIRMLRPPGTAFHGGVEDTTATVAEGTSGYWCR